MEMRRTKAGYDLSLGFIAKRLHDDHQDITHEPLPRRWVDLIHYLDEQERKNSELPRPAADKSLSLAEAELAVRNQEKVLGELMRTDEPTEEATALLEELRQEVARAVTERN